MLTYNASALLATMGQNILYNEAQVTAIVTIGEANKSGNGFNNEGTASFATIDVAITDVPSPSSKDIFYFADKNWTFTRMLSSDGIMKKLLVRADTRHRGG